MVNEPAQPSGQDFRSAFLDTGLLGALRDLGTEEVNADKTRFGPIPERFVASEVMKLASWSEQRLTFSHYRTKNRGEVDLVIEDRRGQVVGIEVKASATARSNDFQGLRQLQEAVGDRFVQGLVLHDHDRVTPCGEKLHAAPLSLVWQVSIWISIRQARTPKFGRVRIIEGVSIRTQCE